jgi:hypothetical protein
MLSSPPSLEEHVGVGTGGTDFPCPALLQVENFSPAIRIKEWKFTLERVRAWRGCRFIGAGRVWAKKRKMKRDLLSTFQNGGRGWRMGTGCRLWC